MGKGLLFDDVRPDPIFVKTSDSTHYGRGTTMKQHTRWIASVAATGLITALAVGCEPPDPEEEPDPAEPQPQQVDDEPVDVGPEGPPELEHAGVTTYPDDPDLIAEGEELFTDYGCQACHAVEAGEPSPTGPNLAGVADRREPEWVARIILHPEEMLELDPTTQELLAEYAVEMPDQGVQPEEVEALVAYVASLPGDDDEGG